MKTNTCVELNRNKVSVCTLMDVKPMVSLADAVRQGSYKAEYLKLKRDKVVLLRKKDIHVVRLLPEEIQDIDDCECALSRMGMRLCEYSFMYLATIMAHNIPLPEDFDNVDLVAVGREPLSQFVDEYGHDCYLRVGRFGKRRILDLVQPRFMSNVLNAPWALLAEK